MRTLVALAAIFAAAPAPAVGRLADVTLIDRDTGEHLPAHFHKGEYWVAGRPGAHYAIHIQSRDGSRLLAVTSVDGVNVVTGETAGHHQRGYVFSPWHGYEIAGWRKNDSEIAAFTFTSIPRSYAARTGRPDHVGVIGVALFREKTPLPREPAVTLQAPAPAAPPPMAERAANADAGAAAEQQSRRASAAQSAKAEVERSAPLLQPGLGTGHGRREHSQVTQVPFERAREVPEEVIRIRYDSRANLVAMGVLPAPRKPGPRPVDPFPDSRLGYVPDP